MLPTLQQHFTNLCPKEQLVLGIVSSLIREAFFQSKSNEYVCVKKKIELSVTAFLSHVKKKAGNKTKKRVRKYVQYICSMLLLLFIWYYMICSDIAISTRVFNGYTVHHLHHHHFFHHYRE